MTNKELQELIQVAKDYQVKTTDLKKILKALIKKDGNIYREDLLKLKFLLESHFLEDEKGMALLEKLLKNGYSNWGKLVYLQRHPIIKNYLLDCDFKKEEWEIILDILLRVMPENSVLEILYCSKLEHYKNQLSNEEFLFFHKIFEVTMNSPLIFQDWYWAYLLDQQKPLETRKDILNILTVTFFVNQNPPVDVQVRIKKAIKCYELYGRDMAYPYAAVVTCIDLEMPQVITKEEYDIYINLYKILCYVCLKDNVEHNFINSFYYRTLTDSTIDAGKRLEFAENFRVSELILKNDIVRLLWNTYLEEGVVAMNVLKYAFLNNGIRTNILCKTFLEQEKDIEVMSLAREVFRVNRVRKDTESLCLLNDLQTKEEKIAFLQFLKNKYRDQDEEKLKREEQERRIQESYNAFLNNKLGLSKLEEALQESEGITVKLVREKRKKESGRKL